MFFFDKSSRACPQLPTHMRVCSHSVYFLPSLLKYKQEKKNYNNNIYQCKVSSVVGSLSQFLVVLVGVSATAFVCDNRKRFEKRVVSLCRKLPLPKPGASTFESSVA